MKIHLIHGIHTKEGDSHIAQLIPYVEQRTGLSIHYHRYGYALALTTGLLNPGRIKKIAEVVEDGDVCIGHSNGCAIIYGIMKLRNLSGAVLINPALDQDIAFPNSLLKWIHIYFNQDDEAVPMTEIPILRTFLFDHSWGTMGKYGYWGKHDPRIKSVDCGTYSKTFPVSGHSDLFSTSNIRFWGTYIGQRIKDELDSTGT